jgi:hypothetical protein
MEDKSGQDSLLSSLSIYSEEQLSCRRTQIDRPLENLGENWTATQDLWRSNGLLNRFLRQFAQRPDRFGTLHLWLSAFTPHINVFFV